MPLIYRTFCCCWCCCRCGCSCCCGCNHRASRIMPIFQRAAKGVKVSITSHFSRRTKTHTQHIHTHTRHTHSQHTHTPSRSFEIVQARPWNWLLLTSVTCALSLPSCLHLDYLSLLSLVPLPPLSFIIFCAAFYNLFAA